MKFKISNTYPQNFDTVVYFARPDHDPKFNNSEIQTAFDEAFGTDENKLEKDKYKVLRMKFNGSYANLILASFDCTMENALAGFRKTVLKIGTKLNELKAKVVYFDNPTNLVFTEDKEEILRQISSNLPLCDYTFDIHKQKKTELTEKEIVIYGKDNYADALNEGFNIAEGVCIARDLVNEPANVLTPRELANRTVELGKKYGFEVKLYSKKECEELGMHAFLDVAKASVNEPVLIVMQYNGGGDEISKGIIGKGLCYDSGGLFIKQGDGMKTMNGDMAGAGAVIGAMCSIAANKLKKNVTTVVAACENLIDGNGYRNGDILQSMSGKTIYVASTDAEGRLTLADAITYMIRKENVDSIVELSTLTGSCATFFGKVCSAVLTTDDDLYNKIADKSEISGEKYWRLPTFAEYKENIKSDVADLYNSSINGAGGISAGMFLNEFKEDKPFMHIDVAGTTYTSAKSDGQIKGATGYGVATVYYYIKG